MRGEERRIMRGMYETVPTLSSDSLLLSCPPTPPRDFQHTCHEDRVGTSCTVAAGILGPHGQVVHFPTMQPVQFAGCCATSAGSRALRAVLSSDHRVRHSSGSGRPGHVGPVCATQEDASHIAGVAGSWRKGQREYIYICVKQTKKQWELLNFICNA